MEQDFKFYSDGISLDATINTPSNKYNNGQKLPVVILCHGHSRHKNDGLQDLAERLSDNNIASLRFTFSGCGRNSLNRYHLYCGSQWVKDLIHALDYLSNFPEFDLERIGVAGISMGGSTVITVSGMDSRIKSTVAMAPIADCREWLEEVWGRSKGDWAGFLQDIKEDAVIASTTGVSRLIHTLDMYNQDSAGVVEHNKECNTEKDNNLYLSLDSVAELLTYRPIDWSSNIGTPVFLLNGEIDELVSIDNSTQLMKSIGSENCSHKTYSGVDHNMPMDSKREQVFIDIVDWFKETLSIDNI